MGYVVRSKEKHDGMYIYYTGLHNGVPQFQLAEGERNTPHQAYMFEDMLKAVQYVVRDFEVVKVVS